MRADDLIEQMADTLTLAEEHLAEAARQGHADGLERALDLRADVLVALDRHTVFLAAQEQLIARLAESVGNVRTFAARHLDTCPWCVDLECAGTERYFDHLLWTEER